MKYTVVHQGVPIGTADLPEQRRWAGGLLEPLPAFEALRPLLAAAANGVAAARLLALPLGEEPDVSELPSAMGDALRSAATLAFELRDAGGLRVPAEVVRLADAGDERGVIVRAYFYRADAATPAVSRPPLRGPGDGAAPSP
jgi:hypothetical protein